MIEAFAVFGIFIIALVGIVLISILTRSKPGDKMDFSLAFNNLNNGVRVRHVTWPINDYINKIDRSEYHVDSDQKINKNECHFIQYNSSLHGSKPWAADTSEILDPESWELYG